MKKQILALAVVGALGVSSVTVASPSSAPAVAAEAQLGRWVARAAARELREHGINVRRAEHALVRAGARLGGAAGSVFGEGGARVGAHLGAL